MHKNSKFGNKVLCGLEDTIWTNINILTLHCALDPECSNPIYPQDTLPYDDVYHQTKSGCQGINSSEHKEESHILIK